MASRSPVVKVDPAMDAASVPVESLESIRLRLSQLTHWLNRLQALVQQPTLPPWQTLHSQFAMVLKQLAALSQTLNQHADTLRATNAYPLPSFPVVQETWLLTTLLRKRVEPEVEEWIKAGAQEGAVQQQQQPNALDPPGSGTTKPRVPDDVWNFARDVVDNERESRAWDGVFTGEELMSNNEGDQKDTSTIGPGREGDVEVSLEQVLRYVYQGVDVHEPVHKVVVNTSVRGPARK
ncbi:mediator of RNA polymerase II transcription complex subunit 8-domain-containing protein [Lipomyces kononenkoae]|uniref:Mediator of RNA polymerase II transcription complex subunit 8-domain-containing protein n=1 Tax=Lipomyces kononenkoae TaxID=34357 RepID=A0ACC3T6N8_LIPKO